MTQQYIKTQKETSLNNINPDDLWGEATIQHLKNNSFIQLFVTFLQHGGYCWGEYIWNQLQSDD